MGVGSAGVRIRWCWFLLCADQVGLVFAQIDENVYREIINHRSLRHPNIIRFKEVRGIGSRNVMVSVCSR